MEPEISLFLCQPAELLQISYEYLLRNFSYDLFVFELSKNSRESFSGNAQMLRKILLQ